MKARVKWIEQATFLGESGSGHTLVMDGAQEIGGRNLGVRPMEALLIGLGGCTSFDIVSILRKARQSVDDCIIEIEAERADTPPKVFTHIHVHYRVIGRGISEDRVARAISLSSEKYCSASIMLGKAVKITHDYEIVEPDPS